MNESTAGNMTLFNTVYLQFEEINTLIHKYPDNANYYIIRAHLYYQQNDFILAIKDCQKAVSLAPNNHHYLQSLDAISKRYINHYRNSESHKILISNLLNPK